MDRPTESGQPGGPFQPVLVALVCTFCTYTAADAAGSARMHYPAAVRVVKYMCTGKVEIAHILAAFENGADAVMVSGCEVGDCHYLEGNLRAAERVAYARSLLAEVGLEAERVEMFHIGASDAPGWVAAVNEMTERARRLGPNPLRGRVAVGHPCALAGLDLAVA